MISIRASVVTVPDGEVQVVGVEVPVQEVGPCQLKLQHTLSVHPAKQNGR